MEFSKIGKLKIRNNTKWNFSYYPVTFENETKLLEKQKELNENGIFPRRYFYPSLNTLKFVSSVEMKVSEDISKRILCLPLYVGLKEIDLKKTIKILNS